MIHARDFIQKRTGSVGATVSLHPNVLMPTASPFVVKVLHTILCNLKYYISTTTPYIFTYLMRWINAHFGFWILDF